MLSFEKKQTVLIDYPKPPAAKGGGPRVPTQLMRARRQRAQRAALCCWRRIVVFANLLGKARVLKFFAPSHFGAFTQSSLVLKFFAARRRELRLRREARDRPAGPRALS